MASVGRAPGNGGRGWMDRLSGGDPLFGNKVSGAILGALLLGMGLNIGSSIIYTPKKPAVPGYDLPAPEAAPAGGSDQQAQAVPLPILLASADPAKGESAAKKCSACHSFDKGGPNKVGPNLYGIVGNAKAHLPNFTYSAALKGKGGQWSYEDLDHFLASPKGYLPGTIMAFAGVSNPKERADILAYLNKSGDTPVPFPAAPAAAEAPAAGAPPGPSQTQQQATPPLPGQRVEPGPAAIPAQPQPASAPAQAVQPGTRTQPTPVPPETTAPTVPQAGQPATSAPAGSPGGPAPR